MTLWRLPSGSLARRCALAAVVDATGTGLVLPVAVTYFVSVLHLSATQVGVGLSIAGGCGVAASVPTGALIDRWGGRRVLIGSYLVASVGYLLYCIAGAYPLFLIAVGLARVSKTTARPARTALIGGAVPSQERVETMAFIHGIQNAALGGGSLLAALALLLNTRAAYLVLFGANVASYLGAAALIWGLSESAHAIKGDIVPTARSQWRKVLTDYRYVTLAGLNAVLSLQHSLLTLAIPLWLALSGWNFGSLPAGLYAVNTFLVVVGQARVGQVGRRTEAGIAAYRPAAWWLATGCLLVAVTPGGPPVATVAVLVLGVVGLTLGEMYSGVGQWSTSMQLGLESSRGRYLSLYAAGQAAEDCFGPALVAFLLAGLGGLGWAVVATLLWTAALTSSAVGLRAVALLGTQPSSRLKGILT